MLKNEKIDELIKCPKIIIEAYPKNGMLPDKKSSFVMRKNLKLQSTDKQYFFEVFIRHNIMLIEQFSIGLLFKTDDRAAGKIALIRYNGQHGQIDWSSGNHYSAFHTHRINEKLLAQKIYEPKHIEITDKFSTFNSALNEFRLYVNLVNFTEYFPHSDVQMSLFQGEY
jgi:hypothetical protein